MSFGVMADTHARHFPRMARTALAGPDLIPLRGGVRITSNLPMSLTPFIGRESELAQLHALLDDSRLLTITGSGGCGKTRLALHAVVDRRERYRDGIWYVELAPLGETNSVVSALAEVLHLQELSLIHISEPTRPY